MKQNKKGFTLLELLVVVLIIGILAAIALPEYKFAVLNSKYSTVKNSAKALYEAELRHYMVNEQYTSNKSDLDIEVGSSCVIESDYDISCMPERTKFKLEYKIDTDTGRRRCCTNSLDATDIYNRVCQKDTNKYEADLSLTTGSNKFNCYYYELTDTTNP